MMKIFIWHKQKSVCTIMLPLLWPSAFSLPWSPSCLHIVLSFPIPQPLFHSNLMIAALECYPRHYYLLFLQRQPVLALLPWLVSWWKCRVQQWYMSCCRSRFRHRRYLVPSSDQTAVGSRSVKQSTSHIVSHHKNKNHFHHKNCFMTCSFSYTFPNHVKDFSD